MLRFVLMSIVELRGHQVRISRIDYSRFPRGLPGLSSFISILFRIMFCLYSWIVKLVDRSIFSLREGESGVVG